MADKKQAKSKSLSALSRQDLELLASDLTERNDRLEADLRNQIDFFASITHEIRTPLTAVLGYAESLLEPDMKLDQRLEAIKTIIGSGQHLVAIVNNLLDISKSEAGQLSVELTECDTSALVSEISHLFQKPAADKQLNFDVKFNSVIPRIFRTDTTRIRSMLINLLSNAMKFTPAGTVTLTLNYDEQSNNLHFAVSDTGIGLTKSQQSNLFAKYKQASNTTRFNFGGTGLGLYLCKRFVEELSGKIIVMSTHGKGSTFEFLVPCNIKNPELVIGTIQPNESISAGTPPRLSGNVLIAEDVIANQQLFKMYVGRTGAEVDLAENGKVALEKAKNQQYALILMDMQMPEMNGIDTTLAIRKFDQTTPILGLSANTDKEEIQCLLDAGCNDYLHKPIQRHAFFKALESYLTHADAPDDNSPITSLLEQEDLPNFEDLVALFITDLTQILDELNQCLAEKNWNELRRVAHRLKGSGTGFGYPMLTEIAGQLEFQIMSENMPNTMRYSEEVKRICERIIQGAKLTPKD